MAAAPRAILRLARGRLTTLPPTVRAIPIRASHASLPARTMHTSPSLQLAKPTNPDPKKNPAPASELALPQDENVGRKRFADFDLKGKVFIVTGGARGLGLALAEGLVEAGGKGKPAKALADCSRTQGRRL